jgi:hypothetical protein
LTPDSFLQNVIYYYFIGLHLSFKRQFSFFLFNFSLTQKGTNWRIFCLNGGQNVKLSKGQIVKFGGHLCFIVCADKGTSAGLITVSACKDKVTPIFVANFQLAF